VNTLFKIVFFLLAVAVLFSRFVLHDFDIITESAFEATDRKNGPVSIRKVYFLLKALAVTFNSAHLLQSQWYLSQLQLAKISTSIFNHV